MFGGEGPKQVPLFRWLAASDSAEPGRPTNLEIAAEFGCDRQTVATWRRWLLRVQASTETDW